MIASVYSQFLVCVCIFISILITCCYILINQKLIQARVLRLYDAVCSLLSWNINWKHKEQRTKETPVTPCGPIWLLTFTLATPMGQESIKHTLPGVSFHPCNGNSSCHFGQSQTLPRRMVCRKDTFAKPASKPARRAGEAASPLLAADPRWVPRIPVPYRGNGPLTIYVFVLLNSDLLSLFDLRLSVCLYKWNLIAL